MPTDPNNNITVELEGQRLPYPQATLVHSRPMTLFQFFVMSTIVLAMLGLISVTVAYSSLTHNNSKDMIRTLQLQDYNMAKNRLDLAGNIQSSEISLMDKIYQLENMQAQGISSLYNATSMVLYHTNTTIGLLKTIVNYLIYIGGRV